MITEKAVAAEIARLHTDFEGWFRGSADVDFDRIERTLSSDFTFVPPSGIPVERARLIEGLRESFGENPITIRIERPVIHWERDGAVLATYEEWHEHPEYATARRATVLLTIDDEAPGGLLWRHVHETWIQPPPG